MVDEQEVDTEIESDETEIDETQTTDESDSTEDNLETDDAESESESEDDDSESTPLADIEYEGQTYQVPEPLKEAVMLHKDYTQKTMALADQRRAFEASQQKFNEQIEQQQTFSKELGELYAVDSQIEQFEALDWTTLAEHDPIRSQQLFFQKQQLEAKRRNLANELGQKQQEFARKSELDRANRLSESESVLLKEVKDWGPAKEAELTKFLTDTFGFTAEDMQRSKLDPRIIKLIDMAAAGKRAMDATGKPSRKPNLQAVKPAAKVKPTGGDSGDKVPKNAKDFAKWRQKYIQTRSTR